MQITKIEMFKYWINWCNWLFVKVSTDAGLYGWGEGSLHGAVESVETAIHELGATLIGQDPAGVERHWHRMYHAWRWRSGPTLMTALGALDIALWDLEGKRLAVPVYRLLGGPYRTQLRGYASHWLADVATPEQAYAGAQAAVRRGFTAFKWSPFDAAMLRTNEAHALAHATELMAAARAGSADRDRRAFAIALGGAYAARSWGLQGAPARSDARGRDHRSQAHRNACRYVLYPDCSPQSWRSDLYAGGDASGGRDPQLLHSGAD